MRGTIKADFAGTYEEAVTFAKENGLKTSERLRYAGNEELPQVSYPYFSREERDQGFKLFDRLGWDRYSVVETQYDGRKRAS